MYFITTKRMLEVCFSAHPNIQYRTFFLHISHISRRNRLLPSFGSVFPAHRPYRTSSDRQ
ncbi:hypothetical protein [[Clostridium] symbiosum]|uniref:hypothetical protein n=1 Tax=Clostridium symbiosum TaxID=1512 RepID=UPI002FE6E0E5